MSLDERLRAGLRDAVADESVDPRMAREQVRHRQTTLGTRNAVGLTVAAAAAVVAGVVWGPGVVASLSGQGDVAPVGQPAERAGLDDGNSEQAAAEPNSGASVEPGTYTYAGGGPFPAAFPYTFTTTVTTLDSSIGGGLYGRLVLGDPYGALEFDFPVVVADLSQLVTDEESATEGRAEEDLLYAGPLDFPAAGLRDLRGVDVGAWLHGAAALDVVAAGTLNLSAGQVPWWDVEVSDSTAACVPDATADDPACVLLWPSLDGQDDPQIGLRVEGAARIYVIETTRGRPLVAVAQMRGGPEDQTAGWLATTDEIVASITFEDNGILPWR
jgi:hypothetical protein